MNSKDRGSKVLGGQVPLRFVQLAACAAIGPDGAETERLVGLDAEGQVWEYRSEFVRFADGHSEDRVSPDGYKFSKKGEMIFWWQPLRMSRDKGMEHEVPPSPVI